MHQVLGTPPRIKGLNKPMNYFKDRNIFLDCRGDIILHPTVMLGYNISIFTMSHNPHDFGLCTYRKVKIERNVFIGSHSILYSCTIGDGAVVAIGTVVRSINIPPNVMIAGNPCEIIATRCNGKWEYAEVPGRTLGVL